MFQKIKRFGSISDKSTQFLEFVVKWAAVPTINANGDSSEQTLVIDLILDIDENGVCTVSTETPGCSASGKGQWKRQGEPKAWGDKDRDLLTLNYSFEIPYVVNEQTGERSSYKVTTEENLVMRDRQNKLEEFSFVMK